MSDLDVLRAAILEAPDAPERWAVLGDALQEAGDPHGRWIALAAAHARSPHDDTTREALERARLEHVRDLHADPSLPLRIVWRFGFPAVVELGLGRESAPCVGILERLDLFAVRGITLMGAADFDAVVDWMAERDWPLLQSLLLGPLHPGGGSLSRTPSQLLGALPALTELRLEGPATLQGLAHPRVENLSLAVRAEVLPELDLAGLPALTTLTLHVRGGLEEDVLRACLGGRRIRLRIHGPLPAGIDAEPAAVPAPDDVPLLTPPEQERGQRFHLRSRFWSIRRRGNALVVTQGRIGRPGLGKTSFHGQPYDAAREYRRQVAAQQTSGWREVHPAGWA